MSNSPVQISLEKAVEILKSYIFTDDLSYMGAVEFVATAFGISIHKLLVMLSEDEE